MAQNDRRGAAAVGALLVRGAIGRSSGSVVVAGSMRGFGGRPRGRLGAGLRRFFLKMPLPLP